MCCLALTMMPMCVLLCGQWSELKQENALAGAGLAVVLALLRLGRRR